MHVYGVTTGVTVHERSFFSSLVASIARPIAFHLIAIPTCAPVRDIGDAVSEKASVSR